MNLQSFGRQTWALTRKNLLIAVARKWLSTFLRSLVFPILVLVLLLEIQNFAKDNNKYGISNPRSIRSLADSMASTSKPLVLVQEPGLGPDFQPVLDKITDPLDSSKLIHLDNTDQIDASCPVDYRGNSPCHAVIIFKDTPLSGHENATWNYTIRTDPSLDSWNFNVFDTDSAVEKIYLPLQLAIENAMLNLTVSPDFMAYTAVTQEEQDEASRRSFIALALYVLSFVYYITFIPVGHHVSGMMASERESGMSALIDAMGGGVAWPRVISYVITFDILYLPLWIILGALYWGLLFPGQSAAVTIFWQIFTGWAITSSSVFGAAFFKRSAFASLWVGLIPWLLAICAAFSENLSNAAPLSQTVALAFFFPSMNYIYFFNALAKSEIAGIRLNMQQPLPKESLGSEISGQADGVNWVNVTGPYFLWIILVAQIIIYALLAVYVEKLLHGNNRRRRTFNDTPEADKSHVAIQTTDLEKQYRPSWFKKFFCCARTPKTKAVDGLNLVSQKRQILCLLGPNGSGKTTTLDMLAGFQAPTGGSISINASPSQLGICPQRNVLWDNLTVYEHLVIWNIVKGNTEDPAALEQLIEKCDLTLKKDSLAKNLSGGMKRKLQLACMLVGGSSICLMDEVTSGLDPLSRRAIWNVVLSERSRRTMVLTTHFLDECEVLSDHIVIITLGKLKCQGTPTELKNQYGGGYRVHIPKTEDISHVPYPIIERQDRFICRAPDSASAAQLLASVKRPDSELYITGPTIEDVFLKVSEEPHTLIGETPEEISIDDSQQSRVKGPHVEPPLWRTYSQQFRALFVKRIQVLRSNWWAYVFALAIPLVATYFIGTFLEDYQTPDCNNLITYASYDSQMKVYDESQLALGPPSVNDTITRIINNTNSYYYYYGGWGGGPYVLNTRDEIENFVYTNSRNISYGAALWIGNDSTPLIAYDARYGSGGATRYLNLANQVRSGVPIAGYLSNLRSYHQAEGGQSMFYVTIFCLLQALYPAFFSLYPTYERRSQVRALQYSNGVRPFPLLFAYWMFDFVFVLIITAVCTAMIAPIAPWFGIGYVWFVQALYGLAAILFAYLISLMSRSQPAAFAFSVLFMAIMYALSVVTLLVIQMTDGANQMANDGTAYGLGIIFPIQNLMRGLAVSLNMYIVRCRGQTMITDPGSFYAFGGPITLLILQNIGLFCLLLWLEGGSFAWITKPKPLPPVAIPSDAEKSGLSSGRPDVDKETARVTASELDLLRALHVTKRFGPNLAVDDVSLGLQEGEILALLGPNGAGKTTMINMIRGDLTPTSGRIYLEGVDVLKNKRLAQKHLGVCPQFDALDLLTVREHLTFYARCKGVPDIKGAVSYVMARVGITAHAAKPAAKLSGGNKRKLSLAIALLGDPPVLLLDEPSSAMDAASKRVLWRTLAAVAPGRSVLLTTHSMEEADALATRAAILARRVLAVGTTEALRKQHSNEYHVHLILRSAPLSPAEEMRALEDWVRYTFGEAVRFEGESLGGQVRFVVPADSRVPEAETETGTGTEEIGADDAIEAVGRGRGDKKRRAARSFTRYLIETLEARKDELGIDCYSISAAMMESVFMKVVKESDAVEDEGRQKKRWWRW